MREIILGIAIFCFVASVIISIPYWLFYFTVAKDMLAREKLIMYLPFGFLAVILTFKLWQKRH